MDSPTAPARTTSAILTAGDASLSRAPSGRSDCATHRASGRARVGPPPGSTHAADAARDADASSSPTPSIVCCQIEEGPATQIKAHFDRGDSVRIIDGAFANFNGFVDDIDEDHSKLRVMVTIFGRQTPVELNYLQVEKT